MNHGRKYLDAVGGQPTAASALDAAEICLRAGFASRSARHSEGVAAAALWDAALETLSRLWQVEPHLIHPVAGLSNAVRTIAMSIPDDARLALNPLSRQGIRLTFDHREPELLEVDSEGHVDHTSTADFVITQAGNIELGTISHIASANSAIIITDATEHVGRMPVLPHGDVVIARADAWAGFTDTCFIINRNKKLELNTRVLTVASPSLTSMVGSVAALEATQSETELLHRALIDEIRNNLPSGVHALGDRVDRLPHIVTLHVQNIDGEALAGELDRRGFAVGAGSACLGQAQSHSAVLSAIGHTSNNHIRVSLPMTCDNVDGFADALIDSIESLRL
ncbi:MAG: hypothetical protein RL410_456 [Actinomycetota bacterium]|jgi:cysteine desulfurase